MNGGYKCSRSAEDCYFDHRPFTWAEQSATRPPRDIILEYEKGNGKSDVGWVNWFKQLAEKDAKGKAAGGEKANIGDERKARWWKTERQRVKRWWR